MSKTLRFVDLFAGLGGFHLGLQKLGHKCVFASELNPDLRALYEQNFGHKPDGDICDVCVDDVPAHDILCAGFPCQPFSKAGEQRGLECPEWGDLFGAVTRKHPVNHRVTRRSLVSFLSWDRGCQSALSLCT